jgi:hypothetical protein
VGAFTKLATGLPRAHALLLAGLFTVGLAAAAGWLAPFPRPPLAFTLGWLALSGFGALYYWRLSGRRAREAGKG